MKRLFAIIIALVLLIPLNVPAQTYNYAVDPAHTTIQFSVKNLGFMTVNGSFTKFSGTVIIDDADLTKSTVDVSIDTASINTGITMRDNHLRSADFFDVAKFPTMTFVATKVEAGTAKDALKVTGNLTIKGVTKSVDLLVTDLKGLPGEQRRTASATAKVNRKDFGVNWGFVIGDDVIISVFAELTK